LIFSSRLAAARFWSALRTALLCFPGLGWQLPFSPEALPGVGSNPGQQCWVLDGFLRPPVDELFPVALPRWLDEARFAADELLPDVAIRNQMRSADPVVGTARSIPDPD
jgi:hypothetical protein